MRRDARSESVSCDLGTRTPPRPVAETAFEKPRGVSRIEMRERFAQVHVSGLAEPIVDSRLKTLAALQDRDVSLDFLKLTPSGMSFLVPEARQGDVQGALEQVGGTVEICPERSILLVHAVNMRDEEGLIASIVQTAIQSEAKVDHISDMHDRMLIVVAGDDAKRLAALIGERFGEAARAH